MCVFQPPCSLFFPPYRSLNWLNFFLSARFFSRYFCVGQPVYRFFFSGHGFDGFSLSLVFVSPYRNMLMLNGFSLFVTLRLAGMGTVCLSVSLEYWKCFFLFVCLFDYSHIYQFFIYLFSYFLNILFIYRIICLLLFVI